MNYGETMVGKTIMRAYVDGFGMTLIFDDGTVFNYSASDGGYSLYGFDDEEEGDK